MEGSAVGSKVNVIVAGTRNVWPAGPSAYAAPPETPPPGNPLSVAASIVMRVGARSAPGGMLIDDPSLAATVPPAGPIVRETCEGPGSP
jgi:hypothetical protein